MSDITYDLNNLTRQYPGFRLHIPSLTLHKGEIFCLIGPSGAGKTTLLRMLNFLEPPCSGKIKYMGNTYHCENFPPDLQTIRRMTTVFQQPALLNESVHYNIAYPLKIRKEKLPREDLRYITETLGISGLLSQSCRTLSGGEAQRVALARALIFRPEVLFLDEPTANLDPQNIQIIEKMVKKYASRYKPTIVWITHNHFQAKRVGDRICLMENGGIVEVNDCENFFHNPSQKRTRDFLEGNMFF